MQIAQSTGLHASGDLDGRPERVAVFAFVAYYLGAKLGFALTFQPYPISALWPPNSILLAALLLTPTRWWWLPIVAALPAHLLSELQGGVPTSMIAAWFVSNCSEALIGAAGIRLIAGERFNFHTLRNVAAFIGCGVVLGPFLSSFIDSAFVTAIGWGDKDYWELWRARFASNALAALTIVPVIVTWSEFRLDSLRRAPFASHVEAAVLSLGLVLVALLLFNGDGFARANPALAIAPVPLFIWAAIRFGSAGASLSMLALALAAISGAAHGHGPFVSGSAMESANSIQLFLTMVAIPLLVLSSSIAEREQSKRALAATEEELRLALSAAGIGTWRWNIAERRGYLSDESKRIFGREWMAAGMTVDVFADLVHPADREHLRQAVRQALRDNSRYEAEFRVVPAGAPERWVLSKGEVMLDPERRTPILVGVNVDVTDAKRAVNAARREAALLESESRFRELADSLPHVIWAARADGGVDYFNRRWHELTGAPRDGAGGSGWWPLLHPEDRGSSRRRWSEAIREALPFELEFLLLCASPDGEYRWQKVRALPVLDESGQVARWNGTMTDVHEAKAAEVALREVGERASQALRREIADHKKTEGALTHLTRVAVLGELTGALAHELNQPLTAILANAQATQRLLAREPFNVAEVRESLADIIVEDKRASAVIQHLRALLKKGEPQFQPVAIEEILVGALDLAQSELGSRGVSCERRLARALPAVMGDRVQLEQVFLNLILNACEAMDEVGSARRALRLETRLDAATIHVSIADTGPGVDPGQLDAMFAPFHTTKQHGLGLGLSISRSIVQSHGGRIWAENSTEGGCVFHLALPAMKEARA